MREDFPLGSRLKQKRLRGPSSARCSAVPLAKPWRGTSAQLVDGLRAIKAAGYSQFGFHVRHGHEMAMLEDWADIVVS